MDFRKGIEDITTKSGEKVSLRKGFLGWSVVHPIKNSDGSINWKNLISGGNWYKLLIIGFIVVILILAVYEHFMVVETARECLETCSGGLLR